MSYIEVSTQLRYCPYKWQVLLALLLLFQTTMLFCDGNTLIQISNKIIMLI